MTVLESLSLLAASLTSAESDPAPLLDFRDPGRAADWRPIHDGVMGGVSTGRARPAEDAVRFEGEVSLDDGGGFASFRLAVDLGDLSESDGLRLRVRGDGQVYKLGVRTDGRWDGVSWQAPFATHSDAWTTVDVAFEDFMPTYHGRFVDGAPPLDPSSIRQLGILVADGQAGPFALDLAWIDVWGSPSRSVSPDDVGRPARARSERLAAALDGGADGATLADMLRREERVLVVATPGALDGGTSRQLGALVSERSELDDRQLRLVILVGTRAGRAAGRTLSSPQVTALRHRWELAAADWSVALVGKDGGVKARWSAPVDPAEVFARIDAMPMRRQELASRSDG